MSARLESPFTWDHWYLPMVVVNGTGQAIMLKLPCMAFGPFMLVRMHILYS